MKRHRRPPMITPLVTSWIHHITAGQAGQGKVVSDSVRFVPWWTRLCRSMVISGTPAAGCTAPEDEPGATDRTPPLGPKQRPSWAPSAHVGIEQDDKLAEHR